MVLNRRVFKCGKAISPAISTVIVTGVVVALVTVALAFASSLLIYRMAESDFNSAKQFMQTVGLQVDDVSWVIGRTETARFSSMYGDVSFKEALNYTIFINTTSQTNYELYSNTSGVICFNMPIEQYSLGNDYFDLIYPSSEHSILRAGTSAPVAEVFAVERLPMPDGSYGRVVVAPTIRMIRPTISDTDYVRLYLPILEAGEMPKRAQSITLTGKSVSTIRETVTGIRVQISFPLNGFDNFFFNFPETEHVIPIDGSDVVLELYIGGVDVAFGVHH